MQNQLETGCLNSSQSLAFSGFKAKIEENKIFSCKTSSAETPYLTFETAYLEKSDF